MGGDEQLAVEVLGPIGVRDGAGRDVTPDGALQRRLLALLVLHRGRVVSTDAAIDALWPGRPPRDSLGALQTHMSRLRRVLPAGVIDSTPEGYCIAPGRLDVDADRLAAAVRVALDREDRDASETIAAILERWHGPAYPELADIDSGRIEAGGLDELRIRAIEARAQHQLAAGATDGLVPVLAALADDEPLRERPRELLMQVLAATGRHAEALRVYDDFRRRLDDELGIAPSPVLTARQAELLGSIGAGSWRPARRLPVAVTSLEGRTTTLDDVVVLAEARRLVTLIGPGGVGKTRLLIETGHRLQAARPERPVVLCELAGAGGASAVDVVAAALSVDRRPGELLIERLAAVLAETEVVLLLDNCEHVVGEIAELVDRLLAACPDVSVVATSRERLRVAGEQLYSIPPLATAQDGPAVDLFIERARAVRPQFEPDATERAAIAEIVRRLDGLPLAIELAAARLHTLDLDQVASGLDRRFDLLSSGARTSARHGSLGAAVSWSFGLLDPELRRNFADLSVFAGAFTVEDAAAICGVDVRAARAVLDELTERSLVVRVPQRRFNMLETLRAFGAEQLAAEGRHDLVSGRHARHFVEWIDTRQRWATESPHAIAELDAGLPELRIAVAWLLDHDEAELAGRLVVGLAIYGLLRLRPEVLTWAESVTAADPDDRSPFASGVWAAASYAAWMAGDVSEAGVRSARAVRLAERDGNLAALTGMAHGNHALFEGRLADAASWYRRAAQAATDGHELLLARSTELLALGYAGDPAVPERAVELLSEVGAACTPMAAYVWYCAGEAELGIDLGRARQRLARAAELAELTGASFVTGVAGTSKASIDARFGDPLAAAEEYRGLIEHWRRAGMWSTQWTTLRSIAGLLSRLGRHREAAVLTGSVLRTHAGHRIFGEDEAALIALGEQLREQLGAEIYAAALTEGAALDGDAAVDVALHALR